MRSLAILVLTSMSFIGACQWWPHSTTDVKAPSEYRLQGELLRQNNRLWLRDCNNSQTPPQPLYLEPAAAALFSAVNYSGLEARSLFADLRVVDSGNTAKALRVRHIYTVTQDSTCTRRDMPSLLLQAHGYAPLWRMKITTHGFLLERAGKPALALPYIEEKLPNGLYAFSSEANGKRIRLYIAPELCIDSQTVGWYSLRARLSIDDEPPQMGCASFGGARNE